MAAETYANGKSAYFYLGREAGEFVRTAPPEMRSVPQEPVPSIRLTEAQADE